MLDRYARLLIMVLCTVLCIQCSIYGTFDGIVPIQIEGRVVEDAHESGIDSATVTLLLREGAAQPDIATVTTSDSEGEYHFSTALGFWGKGSLLTAKHGYLKEFAIRCESDGYDTREITCRDYKVDLQRDLVIRLQETRLKQSSHPE